MPETLYDPPEIEYLDGVPHPKVSPRLNHFVVQSALVRLLSEKSEGHGLAGPELRVNPGGVDAKKTEFVPDVCFVSFERLRKVQGETRQKPPFSPEIAIEVRSPSDNLRFLAEKIKRYLATGSLLVLDVDPETRRIIAHAADGTRTFEAGSTFEQSIVPWLTFEVDTVFANLDAI